MSALSVTSPTLPRHFAHSDRPSTISLTRRGRLARTLVVLSLAVVLASTFGLRAGAGTVDTSRKSANSYITVTVAPGETIWSLAGRLAEGSDQRALIDEIITVNSLSSTNLVAGQKIRVPR